MARAGHFGVGGADRGQGVRVAAADTGLAPLLGELRCVLVRAIEHVAVLGFKGWEIPFKPFEIFQVALAGEA